MILAYGLDFPVSLIHVLFHGLRLGSPAPSTTLVPHYTSEELIIGLIAQSIKKEVAPLIFFIQTIHNVLSSK